MNACCGIWRRMQHKITYNAKEFYHAAARSGDSHAVISPSI